MTELTTYGNWSNHSLAVPMILLTRMKYYNGCLFHKIEKDFLAQTGDPTGTGAGGDSVYK